MKCTSSAICFIPCIRDHSFSHIYPALSSPYYMHSKTPPNSYFHLSALRMCLFGRSSLEQSNFSVPPSGQARQHLQWISSLVPLWQFLSSNRVWTLSPVQPFNELRTLGITTPNIERPRNKCTELVVIELHTVVDHIGNTFCESLQVLLEEGGSGSLRQGEWSSLRAGLGLAKVPVSDGGESNWVRSGAGNKALELLDEGEGLFVHICTRRTASWCAGALGDTGNITRETSFDVVVRNVAIVLGLVPDGGGFNFGPGRLAIDVNICPPLIGRNNGGRGGSGLAAVESVSVDGVTSLHWGGKEEGGEGDGNSSKLHCEEVMRI